MRIVLDTNVLMSGLLSSSGPPAAILRSVLAGSITVCFDERVLVEYQDVLTRGKFRFDADLVADVLNIVEANGEPVLADALDVALPDLADVMFVEVANAAGVDCLVTGNLKHFPTEWPPRQQQSLPSASRANSATVLQRRKRHSDNLHGIRVLTPRAFLDEFPYR